MGWLRYSEIAEKYPAPGFRDSGYRQYENGGGKLYAVGLNGFNWGSSFAGTYTYRLYFNDGAIYPNGNDGRAYGFQLRCLQE